MSFVVLKSFLILLVIFLFSISIGRYYIHQTLLKPYIEYMHRIGKTLEKEYKKSYYKLLENNLHQSFDLKKTKKKIGIFNKNLILNENKKNLNEPNFYKINYILNVYQNNQTTIEITDIESQQLLNQLIKQNTNQVNLINYKTSDSIQYLFLDKINLGYHMAYLILYANNNSLKYTIIGINGDYFYNQKKKIDVIIYIIIIIFVSITLLLNYFVIKTKKKL